MTSLIISPCTYAVSNATMPSAEWQVPIHTKHMWAFSELVAIGLRRIEQREGCQ